MKKEYNTPSLDVLRMCTVEKLTSTTPNTSIVDPSFDNWEETDMWD